MAVPKKRTSSARRDKRRANHKAGKARLNRCPRCHSPRLPHRVCPTCGTYAGREVIKHTIAEPSATPHRLGVALLGRGVTVALDGFGAEQGFGVLAEGARLAAADGIRLRVFGPPEELGLDGVEGIEVVPTSEWIGNEEDPVAAVRAKKEASVVRAAADVAEGRAEAMVSPGSTGATMAAATFGLRRLKGVQRPALAVQLPVPGKPVLFLDVGANVEVRAQHLVQFAFLGAAFSEAVLGVERPRVGLLSVGEEAGKGREEVVAANEVLSGVERDRVRRQRRGPRPARPERPTSSSPTASPATSR